MKVKMIWEEVYVVRIKCVFYLALLLLNVAEFSACAVIYICFDFGQYSNIQKYCNFNIGLSLSEFVSCIFK
jgi:hypothetical protein